MKKFLPIVVLCGLITTAGIVVASQGQGQAKAEQPTIAIALANHPQGLFDVMALAIERAGLTELLDGTESYTVLAPLDPAFVRSLEVADEAAAIEMIEAYDETALRALVAGHIINGNRKANSLLNAKQYSTLDDGKLDKETLQAAGIAARDWDARNGTIHVLDRVLLP